MFILNAIILLDKFQKLETSAFLSIMKMNQHYSVYCLKNNKLDLTLTNTKMNIYNTPYATELILYDTFEYDWLIQIKIPTKQK